MAEKSNMNPEIENLNLDLVDVDSLSAEELDAVSGGVANACDVYSGPCGTFTGGCRQYGTTAALEQ